MQTRMDIAQRVIHCDLHTLLDPDSGLCDLRHPQVEERPRGGEGDCPGSKA